MLPRAKDRRSPQGAFALDVIGHVDLCGPNLIEGWIYWRSEPDTRFVVEVFADGRVLGRAEADRFRPDLQEAGYADGRYAFTFSLPPSVSVRDFSTTRIRIQNSSLFLMPDEATNVWRPAHRAGETVLRAVG